VNWYDVGDRVRVYTETPFQDAATPPVPFDPDVVTVLVRAPGGTVTAYEYGADPEVVKLDVGEYELELDVEAAGEYRYRFQGETSGGENQGASEGRFGVRRQGVTPPAPAS
jgi:hypothetical protein